MSLQSLTSAGLPGNFCSFLIGCSLTLAFAPYNIWLLAVLSPALLLPLVQQLDLKQTAIRGWYFGFGHFLTGVSWVYVSIHEYGYTPAPIAGLLALMFAAGLALVFGLQFYCYRLFNFQRSYLLSFPALWLAFEWFRSWFLTGFPWIYLGYAHIDSPLASFAPILGVYGLSFISLLISTSIFMLLKNIISQQRTIQDAEKLTDKQNILKLISSAMIIIIVIFSTASALKPKQWTQRNEEKKLELHLIQGNIPQHEKWLPENQTKILEVYYDLIQQSLLKTQGHLIMLPEAAMPTLNSELSDYMNLLDQGAHANNSAIITGIFYDEGAKGFAAEKIYNSIVSLGRGSGLYNKQQLVPFGEFLPFESTIRGLIPFFDLPFSWFTRGEKSQKGLTALDYEIAPFICYEILYPELAFRQSKTADFLITISNDAWFGNSAGPDQHFQMARMRALELGKYLIRTTNTGTTAVIDHKGKVVKRLNKDERAILETFAYAVDGETPYSRYGTKPILIFSAGLLIICLLLSRKAKAPT